MPTVVVVKNADELEHVYAVPELDDITNSKEPEDQKAAAASQSENDEKLLSVVVLENKNAETDDTVD